MFHESPRTITGRKSMRKQQIAHLSHGQTASAFRLPRRNLAGQRQSVVAMGLVLLSLGACVADRTYNPGRLGPEELGQINGLCRNVMGLSWAESVGPPWAIGGQNPYLGRWENHFQACVDTLSDSLSTSIRLELSEQSRRVCLAQGLARHGPAYAVCVLHGIDVAQASSSAPSAPIRYNAPAQTHKLSIRPFLRISPAEAKHREELACAYLGLDPLGGKFSTCMNEFANNVGNLDRPIY